VLSNLVAGIEDWKLMERESPGMLTSIKASLLASALMLLESCTGYLTRTYLKIAGRSRSAINVG